MSRFNMRRLAVAITVASTMVGGLIATSGCVATGGTSCGQGCCARDVDCRGGKTCHYGECLCPDPLVDCGTGACMAGPCPTCSDGVQNGAETDIDCGGGVCPPCLAGKRCGVDRDCLSGVCQGNVCQASTGCAGNSSTDGNRCTLSGGGNGICIAAKGGCVVSSCGDGFVDLLNGEQCDDGAANGTEKCAYGQTSCTVCSASCKQVPGATSYCGDGILDSAKGEQCDAGAANGMGCTSTCTV